MRRRRRARTGCPLWGVVRPVDVRRARGPGRESRGRRRGQRRGQRRVGARRHSGAGRDDRSRGADGQGRPRAARRARVRVGVRGRGDQLGVDVVHLLVELRAPVGVVDVAELRRDGLERLPRLVDPSALQRDACGVQRGADGDRRLDGVRLRGEDHLRDGPQGLAGPGLVGACDHARADQRDRDERGRGAQHVGLGGGAPPAVQQDRLGDVVVLEQRQRAGPDGPDDGVVRRGTGLLVLGGTHGGELGRALGVGLRLGRQLCGGAQRRGAVQQRLRSDVGDPAREQGDELALDVRGVARSGRRRHEPGGQGLDEVVVGAHRIEVERPGIRGRPSGLVADVARTHEQCLHPGSLVSPLGSLQHRTMFLLILCVRVSCGVSSSITRSIRR